MTRENRTICPVCQGKKVVAGTCECNAEWRGTRKGDDRDDCQCVPEQQCPMCKGTGSIDEEKDCS